MALTIKVHNQCGVLPFEDYSDGLVKVSDGVFEWENCWNNNQLCESAFKRLVKILENDTYAILGTCPENLSKEQNIIRNRRLREILGLQKMSVYLLVGRWKATLDGDEIERSYAVRKPQNMDYERFKEIIRDCLTIDGETQNYGIIHKDDDKWFLYYPNKEKSDSFLGSHIDFNKVAQAYTQWVKRIDKPFVFEFLECPSSNSGRMMFRENNILYIAMGGKYGANLVPKHLKNTQ